MNQRPFTVILRPNSNGFHRTLTQRCPISGPVVRVKAAQAVGAVVTMPASRSCRGHRRTAIRADKAIAWGFIAIINLRRLRQPLFLQGNFLNLS